MNPHKSKPRKSSRSLARKLGAELAWRRCFRNIAAALALSAVVFIGWCFWSELSAGGGIRTTVSRSLSGDVNFIPDSTLTELLSDAADDIRTVFRDLADAPGKSSGFSDSAAFHSVIYSFTVDGEEHHADCTGLLNAAWWIVLATAAAQILEAIYRSLAGSRVIRKYLRPIDEIAVMAEKLSAETADRHTVTSETARTADPDGLSGGVKNLAVAIDRIEDSGTRIEVHDTELGGLEAALNNMLRRLDESKRSQIRFVDDASHELRTPIAVIQGYAGMLDRWGKDDPKVRDEAIEAIRTEADHMKTLVDQLLFLARGEMDRHVMEPVPVDLCECLKEIAEESEMLDSDHTYLLETGDPTGEAGAEADPASVTVTADAAMLKQCIRIIRDNAAKYTPKGGEITFRTMLRGDEAVVEVQDTGIGIPAEEIPRIFDRFYRGSNARKDNAGGSGLGLSIAKWIVDQHGGRIEAVSVPELGTRMRMILNLRRD